MKLNPQIVKDKIIDRISRYTVIHAFNNNETAFQMPFPLLDGDLEEIKITRIEEDKFKVDDLDFLSREIFLHGHITCNENIQQFIEKNHLQDFFEMMSKNDEIKRQDDGLIAESNKKDLVKTIYNFMDVYMFLIGMLFCL